MRLIELKCSNCGADMKINPELKQVSCNYCGHTMLIDDEIQKTELINGYGYGYEVERGRIAAKKEQELRELEEEKHRIVVKAVIWSIVFVIMIVLIAGTKDVTGKIWWCFLLLIPLDRLGKAIKGLFLVSYKQNKVQKELYINSTRKGNDDY